MSLTGLVGRDAEFARARAVIDDASCARTRVLVLRGEAGSGKTALLDAAVHAAPTDMTALRASGLAGASAAAMSGLFDLTRGLMHLVGELAEPQRDALLVAVGAAPAAPPADRFMVGVALMSLLAAAAAERMLLVAVDDVAELDVESRSALLFAVRRLEAVRVAVLLTVRSGDYDHDLSGLEVLEVGPLTRCDAATLLDRAAPALDQAGAARVLDAADGNPLALVELPKVLGEDRGWDSGAPLPLTERLERSFGAQLARLPDATIGALLVAAAASPPEVQVVQAAMAVLSLPADALDAAEEAGIVTLGGGQVSFRHPLLRAAAFATAGEPRQRAAHRALAAAWARTDALGHQAHHLAAAATGPDEAVAALLERAANEEAARGAHASASMALERAATLSSSAEVASRRRLAAAETSVAAGDTVRAFTLAADALMGTHDVVLAARVQLLRGRIGVLGTAMGEIADDVDAAAAAVEDRDPELALQLRVESLLLGSHTRDRETLADTARIVAGLAAATAPVVRRRATIALATMHAFRGELAEARGLIADLEPLDGTAANPVETLELFGYAALARGFAEDFRGAIATVGPLISAARAYGAVGALPFPLAIVANASFLLGDFARARSAAAEAAELAEASGQVAMQVFAGMCQALVSAGRGEEQACRDHVAAGLHLAEAVGAHAMPTTLHWALGQLELSLDNPAAAVASLVACRDLLSAAGAQASPGVVRYDADLVEALALLGRRKQAAAAQAALAERAASSGSAYGAAAAARCRGIVAPARSVDAAFTQALHFHAQDPNPFELGRTELAWGRRLVASGRLAEASGHLRDALGLFIDLEAEAWTQRARELLRASDTPMDARDRSVVAALSPREVQIAAARAGGAAAEEIAAQLFLPVAAVRRTLADVQERLGAGTPRALSELLGPSGLLLVEAAPATTVRVLGDFDVRIGGEPVAGLGGHPGRTLGIVAASGGRLATDELVEVLWPDQPEGLGRARLRHVLWRLTEAAGPLVVRDGETVRLRATAEVDVITFERAADAALAAAALGDAATAEASARAAVAAYAGDLLPGEGGNDWVLGRRERLRRRFLAALDLLAMQLADRGEQAEAVAHLERAIAIEPLDDERYLTAANVLLACGRSGAARRMVERAVAVARELGLPPSPAARALARLVGLASG